MRAAAERARGACARSLARSGMYLFGGITAVLIQAASQKHDDRPGLERTRAADAEVLLGRAARGSPARNAAAAVPALSEPLARNTKDRLHCIVAQTRIAPTARVPSCTLRSAPRSAPLGFGVAQTASCREDTQRTSHCIECVYHTFCCSRSSVGCSTSRRVALGSPSQEMSGEQPKSAMGGAFLRCVANAHQNMASVMLGACLVCPQAT